MYAFHSPEHGTFTPAGRIAELKTAADTDEYNRAREAEELVWLHTAPDRVFLYVKLPVLARDPKGRPIAWATSQNGATELPRACIQTWLGTCVSERTYIGPAVPVGGIAGRYARKRSVDCRIFGVRYVGWYYESAGDYCRLRKAKRQEGR